MLEGLFLKHKAFSKKKKEKVKDNQDVCSAFIYSSLSEAKAKIVHASLVDDVNHPKHYTSHPSGVECIQITEHFGFNLGNVIKYLWRAEEKGAPLQDLEKARWYLDREIQKRKGGLSDTNTR